MASRFHNLRVYVSHVDLTDTTENQFIFSAKLLPISGQIFRSILNFTGATTYESCHVNVRKVVHVCCRHN